ncbi:MAG: MotA/TolQ/ExbB proton channel family protein [Bdellovibrionales bacterium]
MNFVITLILATAAVAASLIHLDQELVRYWDFVAFAMVFGGTLAVSAAVIPWRNYKLIFSIIRKLLFNSTVSKKLFLEKCIGTIQSYKAGGYVEIKSVSTPADQILADGYELLNLGIKKDKVEHILEERIHTYMKDSYNVATSIRSLAKYPPAFGLAGTVFGLVELMRGVSQGLPVKETGIKMAIALVATLYGLMVANLFISPAGEQATKMIKDEENMCDIALQAILLAAGDDGLLESQEFLNSMVLKKERIQLGGMQQGAA